MYSWPLAEAVYAPGSYAERIAIPPGSLMPVPDNKLLYR